MWNKSVISVIFLILFHIHSIFAIVPPPVDEFDLNVFEGKDRFLTEDAATEVLSQNEPIISKSELPRKVIPIHYKIQVRPIFDPIENSEERYTCPGSVRILVECQSSTNEIVLNTNNINVTDTSVKVIDKSNGAEIPISSQIYLLNDTTYTIRLKNSLEAGKNYEIQMDFVSKIQSDKFIGFYFGIRKNYTTFEREYSVSTHFEPYGARRAFPCFDDPDLKAVFDVSIGRREKYNSLSNMDLIKTEPIKGNEGWFWDHYNSTVKMSTYIVAMVVSEYTSETADSSLFGGRPVKIWGPKSLIDQQGGVYSANTVAKTLEFYEEYFDVKYPLPKMDSIALPYQGGAMENYGLNTYSERLLMYLENDATEGFRYTVSSIIAHELAHQWFGNYVTCKTWPHIWLNEGLTSYVQRLGLEALYPEFEGWNLFVSSAFQNALRYDQSPNAYPLVNDSNPVPRFSGLTYDKGASLVRMMQMFLGEAGLKRGLSDYLRTFAYGSTRQNDLFEVLESSTGGGFAWGNGFSTNATLTEIMETWTLQSGYPLVKVSAAQSGGIHIIQEKFYAGNTTKFVTGDKNDGWWIPISIAVQNKTELTNFWVPKHQNSYVLYRPDINTSGWVIVNPNAKGFYRVVYDNKLIKHITTQMDRDHKLFSCSTRSQLFDDQFTLAWSDYIPISTPLRLMNYLADETELNVWMSVLSHLNKPYALFSNMPQADPFRNYILHKISGALKNIGIEGKQDEKGGSVMLRSRLIDWACALEDKDCVAYASELFQKWSNSTSEQQNPIPRDIRSTILCTAVSAMDTFAWKYTFEKYMEELNPTQKHILLQALGCSKNSTILEKFLSKTLIINSGITRDDIPDVFQSVISNSVGRELGINFLVERFEEIYPRLDGSSDLVPVFQTIARFIYLEKDVKKLETFREKFPTQLELVMPVFNATLEIMRSNGVWISKFYEPMKSFFEQERKAEL